jgi:hypothetical protein
MSTPKRQHWVPSFYLRYFAVSDTPESPEQVWILHRKEGRAKLTAIRNIAVEKYLYTPKREDGTRDLRLENKLEKLETHMGVLWPKLIEKPGSLLRNNKIRRIIALFLSVQFLRHPKVRELMEIIHYRLHDLIKQQPTDSNGNPNGKAIQIGSRVFQADDIDWATFRDVDSEPNEGHWHAFLEKEAVRFAEYLMTKRWSVGSTIAPLLITSDYPVYVVNPELKKYQFRGKDATILFPISPTRMLCLDDLDEPKNQCYPIPNDQVNLFNMLTWHNTESFIISPRKIDDVLVGIEEAYMQCKT